MQEKGPDAKTTSGLRCPACGKTFSAKADLDEHLAHEHGIGKHEHTH